MNQIPSSRMSHHAQRLRELLSEAQLAEFLVAAYDEVLAPVCGAPGTAKDHSFVAHHLGLQHPTQEWRFCGSLGFGGKFRLGSDLLARVDCYREDETPARLATIEAANAALLALRERFVPGALAPA